MGEQRCIHDMLPGQCAICLHHDDPPSTTIESMFTARYDGHCSNHSPLNHEHRIKAGDLVGWTEAGVVCSRCVQGAQ